MLANHTLYHFIAIKIDQFKFEQYDLIFIHHLVSSTIKEDIYSNRIYLKQKVSKLSNFQRTIYWRDIIGLLFSLCLFLPNYLTIISVFAFCRKHISSQNDESFFMKIIRTVATGAKILVPKYILFRSLIANERSNCFSNYNV